MNHVLNKPTKGPRRAPSRKGVDMRTKAAAAVKDSLYAMFGG